MERHSPRIVAALLVALAVVPARAQDTTTGRSALGDQLNKALTDPAEMERLEKERSRPPIEVFKSSILPNDVLPYAKANHWSTLALDLRSNQVNYAGTLETQPVALHDMPHSVVFRRDAGLVRGQRSRLLLQVMTPTVNRELNLLLSRPESLRADETYAASLRVLEPHQMLIPVLTKGPNDAYGRWNQLRTIFPASGNKSDTQVYDRQRYYRMVLPEKPEKPELPGHPLTWTTISHVIWDGLAPETLSVSQQEAMLDWLHWGGQLVIVGGAIPSYSLIKDSFLGPYLPADADGSSAELSGDDLGAFSKAYPPIANPVEPDEPIEATQAYVNAFQEYGRRYRDPVPIVIPRGKPLYLARLTPRPGSRSIGSGSPTLPPVAVERRVGRGRITMLGIALTDPALLAWPGYETFVRRVVLRRPEETLGEELRYNGSGIGGYLAPRYDTLSGPDLTWTRIFGRDLGAPTRRVRIDTEDDGLPTETSIGAVTIAAPARSSAPPIPARLENVYAPYQVPVAEWLDTAALPTLSRQRLEAASGIEIPGLRFVLAVLLGYLVLLVPVNWLVCRFAFGRREWAWVAVPILAIGFAVGVERAAAYDVGYDSACNEIDLIETFGDYPRGHLSRFASLYTTGRVKFSISYPDDPTALVLPMTTGRSIRGEDVQQSVFQSNPGPPTLSGFQVQPRSLSMFRAEGIVGLPGGVTLVREGQTRKVVNTTGDELRDAVVVEVRRGPGRTIALGTIAAGATVEIQGEEGTTDEYGPPPIPGLKTNQVSPAGFLELLVKSSVASRPEDVGELRLIAWTPGPRRGEVLEPAVDVHQGFTLVVAHLELGPTPDPASARYNILALGPESPSNRMLTTPPPPPVYNNRTFFNGPARATPKPAPRPAPLPAPAIPIPDPPKTPGDPDGPAAGNAPETERP